MPRLFFATYDGERFASDEEGIELESIEAAKLLGQKALADMTKDGCPTAITGASWSMLEMRLGRPWCECPSP
jgi:hypothetical protein